MKEGEGQPLLGENELKALDLNSALFLSPFWGHHHPLQCPPLNSFAASSSLYLGD